MRWHWTHWRRPLLLAIVMTTALFFGPSMIASAVPARQPAYPTIGQPLDQLSGDAFDQAFLAQMTMHHAMGVMMTQPVITGAAHRDLQSLGTQMIADQSREIDQMRGWLQAWYGQDASCPMVAGSAMPGPGMRGWMPGPAGERPGAGMMAPGGMMPGHGMPLMPWMGPGMLPGMMPGGPMSGMPMMSGLWSLPPDQLDATFMTWMIAHHQGAIDMAALAEERAAHQEVKDLAASIISSQSVEIGTMEAWLAEWYGR
jgi:uncharacterized protein (DUF305 family)